CGDAAYLTKLFHEHNIWRRIISYTGVDLSSEAMKIGEENIKPMLNNDAKLTYVKQDMSTFAEGCSDGFYDCIFSSLAIHHLQDNEKENLLQQIRRILKPNGCFIMVDICLQEDENRNDFIQDIATHIRNDWIKLDFEQITSVISHLVSFDFPAKLSVWKKWAEQQDLFKNIICFETLRFYKTIVMEC
ncbi:unnamed protein product, partial [Didymodactylos carnosus]